MPPVNRFTCQTCRVRHLQCNGQKPKCRQCTDSGRECVPHFNIRFSSSRQYTPLSGARPRSQGSGQNQTGHGSTTPTSYAAEEPQDTTPDSTLLRSPSPVPTDEALPPLNYPDSTPIERSNLANPPTPPSLVSRYNLPTPSASQDEIHSGREAVLLQYFGTNLGGPWLNLTDPDFTVQVLQNAPLCPALRWSVLALSSFHLSRVEGSGFQEADVFHQKAVSALMLIMQDRSLLTDDAVLASTVILRLYEESKAHREGIDAESHLLGGHIFATIMDEGQGTWTKLANAAFWVHQRQDVFRSMWNQRATRTRVSHAMANDIACSNDVYAWVRRATMLTGRIVDFCFGHVTNIVAVYHELQREVAEWFERSSPLLLPIQTQESSLSVDTILPELRFTTDAGVTGYAHSRVSQLLLALYDPTGPQVGPQSIQRHKRMAAQVKAHVRALCGIAVYNTCPVGRVIACFSISLCGNWIDAPAEQHQILRVLKLTEDESGWSHRDLEEQLRYEWNMAEEQVTAPAPIYTST